MLHEELEEQNKQHEIKLFQVKLKTLGNALKMNKEGQKLTMMQETAMVQLLSLEDVRDRHGELVKTNFVEKKRDILMKML